MCRDVPVKVFDSSLAALQKLVQVERLVMDKLFWSHDPVMQTVHPTEPWVASYKKQVSGALDACLPIARQYLSTLDLCVPPPSILPCSCCGGPLYTKCVWLIVCLHVCVCLHCAVRVCVCVATAQVHRLPELGRGLVPPAFGIQEPGDV